jgi:hypothetical protein
MSDPVSDGRDALNTWPAYPWYEAKTDGVRRVEVQQPWTWGSNASLGALMQLAAWTVVALALAIVAYYLIRAFARRERDEAGEGVDGPAGADRIESLPIPLADRPRDLLDEARLCRERGDFGRAIVFLFSHQLWQLDRHGRIRLGRGKTNRQYLREIRTWPALRGLVEQTVSVFEDFFFGHHAVDRLAFEACWSRLDEFETLVIEGIGARGEGRGQGG